MRLRQPTLLAYGVEAAWGLAFCGVGTENSSHTPYTVPLYFLAFSFNEKETKSGRKNTNSNKSLALYCIVGRKGIAESAVRMSLACFVIVDKIYEFDLPLLQKARKLE